MPRYRVTIEYDGRGLAGWQRQENGLGVQQVVEEAIGKLAGETVTVHGAGRTDAGVHALGQVAHFDLERDFDAKTIRDALNFHIKPRAVVILSAVVADSRFHARFDARSRAYEYRIVSRRVPLTLDRGRAWWVPQPLDVEAMNEAAQILVGRHDFTTFRAAYCQARSPVKTLDSLEVTRSGEEIRISAHARSFLHHQVRNMAGTLKLLGEGKWSADDLRAALAARDRAAGGPTAPAEGLYLLAVTY